MYQHSPDHNAVIPRKGFRAKWIYDSGAKINGGIAISGNTVYIDAFDGSLIALNLLSGKQLWRAVSDNIVMSGLAPKFRPLRIVA
jgi:outer membrane protein assembly factor BamB